MPVSGGHALSTGKNSIASIDTPLKHMYNLMMIVKTPFTSLDSAERHYYYVTSACSSRLCFPVTSRPLTPLRWQRYNDICRNMFLRELQHSSLL